MRYWCPVTLDDDPKWIGGNMTIRQGVYAVAAGLVDIGLIALLHHVWIVAIFLGVIPAFFAFVLGWVVHKRSGDTMDRALLLAYRFKRSQKVFLYQGVPDGGLGPHPQTR